MRIVTFRRIKKITEKYPASSTALADWYHKVSKKNWKNFADIKMDFNSVDYIGNSRFVFNIKENNYPLDYAVICILKEYLPDLPSFEESKRRFGEMNFSNYLEYCQEYGGPSRLLDFTYSFDIATFFAIYKRKKKSASVFAINLDNILNCTFVDSANDSVEANGKFNSWNILERFVKGENDYREGIYYFCPEEKTARLIQQEGVFLFPSTLNRSFENLLFRQPLSIL